MLPFAISMLLGVYVVIQLLLSKRMMSDEFKAKHSGRGVVPHLSAGVDYRRSALTFHFCKLALYRSVSASNH